MSDILAALERLEVDERKQRPKKAKRSTATKFVNPLVQSSNSDTRTGRSRDVAPQPQEPDPRPQSAGSFLSPTSDDDAAHPSRSPSQASTRRISIIEPPTPPSTHRRVRILTKTNYLGSGFKYDEALGRYGVNEASWNRFSDDIVNAANLSKSDKMLWFSRKADVAKKVKKDLMYESSQMKAELKAWNASFKSKGFSVNLEVPDTPKFKDGMTEEEKALMRKESKFFRVVLNPGQEKGGSIYSRTSSLSRSIRGEGTARRRSEDDEDEGKEGGDGTDERKSRGE